MKYTAFLPDVLPHLNADPSEPVALNAIKNAAIDFCKRSWVWREYSDPITTEAGVQTYDITPSSPADITVVMSVRHNGQTLTPKRQDWLDESMPNWQSDTGTPKYYTQLDTASLSLVLTPDTGYANGLVLAFALQPLRRADSLPDWIASQYWEGIAAGAVSRLMLMNNKPWTDLAVGKDKQAQFESSIGEAKEDGVRALGRAVTRVTPQH